MNDLLRVLAGFVLGYLLGSVSTAVIVGRAYGKDILEHGSRSAGLTNTLRVLGKTAAAVVLAGDVVKGVLACLIGLWLGVYLHAGAAVDCVSLLAAGAGAVIGHNWSIYFGFKGGKGCVSAWKVDPSGGVIGVQNYPPGFEMLPFLERSGGGDAERGHDCPDPAGSLC
ncbi:glycerol-3-phosphate acyltransferase [Roseomonas mucosa]|jgi:acyl phosphate:glycerol-3-phosphate acyltransferase|uniref:glycerol-3-phosphate acyltransferase n=1 Tax=Roseomonas mucosa TaxID=207340 RepID=UPI00384E049F